MRFKSARLAPPPGTSCTEAKLLVILTEGLRQKSPRNLLSGKAITTRRGDYLHLGYRESSDKDAIKVFSPFR